MINKQMHNIDSQGVICHFKLHQRRKSKSKKTTVAHVHGSWQLELILDGIQKAEINNCVYELSAGTVVLIPPQIPHGFTYATPTSWLSIKFNATGNVPHQVEIQGINQNPVLKSLLDTLDAALPDFNPGAKTVAIVNHLLAALMTHFYFSGAPTQQISSQLDKISLIVSQRRGKPVTVAEIAKSLGYSTSHLSAWYRRHTGIPIKQFIDHERMNFARELLLYSDLNIGEIADQLEFPDLFAFSRFFHRHQQQGPLKYRQEHTFQKIKGS